MSNFGLMLILAVMVTSRKMEAEAKSEGTQGQSDSNCTDDSHIVLPNGGQLPPEDKKNQIDENQGIIAEDGKEGEGKGGGKKGKGQNGGKQKNGENGPIDDGQGTIPEGGKEGEGKGGGKQGKGQNGGKQKNGENGQA